MQFFIGLLAGWAVMSGAATFAVAFLLTLLAGFGFAFPVAIGVLVLFGFVAIAVILVAWFFALLVGFFALATQTRLDFEVKVPDVRG